MKGGVVKHYRLLDERTGEVFAVGIIPWRSLLGGAWMKVFQAETTRLLIAHPELHGQSCRVLLHLQGMVEWNNKLPEPQEAAQALGIHRVAVYRAYAELVKARFIFREGKEYYLNPMVGWKGTDSQYRMACERLLSVGRQDGERVSLLGGGGE